MTSRKGFPYSGEWPAKWPSELQILSVVAEAVFEERPDYGLTWQEVVHHDSLEGFTGTQIRQALLAVQNRGNSESISVAGTDHQRMAIESGEPMHGSARLSRITEQGMQLFGQLVTQEIESAAEQIGKSA